MGRRMQASVAAIAVVVGLAPALSATPAAAEGIGGVVLSESRYSTSTPRCDFVTRFTQTVSGTEATALHAEEAWSCPGMSLDAYPVVSIDDDSVAEPYSSGSTLPLLVGTGTFYGNVQRAEAGTIAVDYTHPKTGHAYEARFHFDVPQYYGPVSGLSNAVGAPDVLPFCANYSTSRQLGFFCASTQRTTVGLAPEVGPAAVSVPLQRSLTLTANDGSTCELNLALTASATAQLSYLGSVPAASCTIPDARVAWANALVYPGRREVTSIGGSGTCFGCRSSGGMVPATPGQNFTVTYYVVVDLGWGSATFAALPPECSLGGYEGSGPPWGPMALCELTASGIYP